MATLKVLTPVIRRLHKKLALYSHIFNIENKSETKVSSKYDCSQIITIKTLDDKEIISFWISTELGVLKGISLYFNVKKSTIRYLRFILADLRIPDYSYTVEYYGKTIYPDIKPYEVRDCHKSLDPDSFEYPLDRINDVIRYIRSIEDIENIDTAQMKNINSIRFTEKYKINIKSVFSLLPNIKYVFVEDEFENPTAYELINGEVTKCDVDMFEYSISLVK